MKYEKPDMKVYTKSFITDYEKGIAFMRKERIGNTIVCTGQEGIIIDLPQLRNI